MLNVHSVVAHTTLLVLSIVALQTAYPQSTSKNKPRSTTSAPRLVDSASKHIQARPAQAIRLLERAIELEPDLVIAHRKLSEAARSLAEATDTAKSPSWSRTAARANEELEPRYKKWMTRFPTKAIIPFQMGLNWGESPKAAPYFRRVVEIDPKHSEAWMQLSLDAEMRGDGATSLEYVKRAADAHPDDPNYAAYYAFKFMHTDTTLYRRLSLELVNRFPTHDRGAQSLYWLAYNTRPVSERLAILERLRTSFAPDKYSWSESGMGLLFDDYVTYAPEKAVGLATEMLSVVRDRSDRKPWTVREAFAQKVAAATKLLSEGKPGEAATLLNGVTAPKYMHKSDEALTLLRARALDGSGNAQGAYDAVLETLSKSPSDSLAAAATRYGGKLGKASDIVERDVATLRDSRATTPAPFSLNGYEPDTAISLAAQRGRVVLVTFWFPGCGPCRREYPYFQNVLQKYKDRGFEVLAINGIPEQDDFVIPFLKNNRYSFTPLRVPDEKWAETNYSVRGYPSNFLIDKEGKVIYKSFMIGNPEEQRMLELMIEGLLTKQVGASH
jgi:thiol-disulfide isomerase/thioredoxin